MKNENKEKGLRPGEVKILKALSGGPLNNTKLGEATGLSHQPNVLIDYLRRLKKIGLVERDLDNRQYYIKNLILSEEMLLFNDIAYLIQNQIKISINDQKEKNQEFFKDYWGKPIGFATVENSSEFLEKLKARLNDPETKKALRTVAYIVSTEWKAFVLSFGVFSDTERKIIVQWEKSLLELEKMLYNHLSERETKLWDSESTLAEAQKSPDRIRGSDVLGRYSESEKKRVNEIVAFLDDQKNRKIYFKYYDKVKEGPKTLLVYSLLGFDKDFEPLFTINNKDFQNTSQALQNLGPLLQGYRYAYVFGADKQSKQ